MKKYVTEEEKKILKKMFMETIRLSEVYFDALYELEDAVEDFTDSKRFADRVAQAIHNGDVDVEDFMEALDLQF